MFLPGSGPIELPELDAEIADLWEVHVYTAAQACGVVDFSDGWKEMDIVPIKFDWEKLRNKIAEAMRLTAYARFYHWYRRNGKKRQGSGSEVNMGPIYLKPEEIARAKGRKVSA